jgi:phage minor structural protein
VVSNIFILDKNLKTKLILSINGHNTFFKDLYDLDLSTGTESYEFSTTAEDINESDYIMFHYHGDYKLFQIIDIEQEHREGKIITSVYGESACLELLNGVTDPIMNEEGKALSMTAGEFIDRVLTRSDWQRKRYSSSLDNKVVDVKIEKTKQIWPVIQEYMKEFGYEITTRVKYENGHVKKKYIDVYAEGELGNKTCKRFEYNRNVKGITKKKNLYDFCTALILETKQDTQGIMYGIKDGNVLKPKDGIIKGPDANAVCAVDNNKIYNAGKDWIYGVYEDNDSGSGTEAVEKAVEELKRRSVPKFDYECDTAVSYAEYENINIGDTVYVIDHTFNPIITLEARVGKLEISFTDRDNCKCTLSNYKEIKTRITADDSHIKELLDKTTIQYGDKDTGKEEITLKDDYLDTKDKVDELENKLNKHLKDCEECGCDGGGSGNIHTGEVIIAGERELTLDEYGDYQGWYGKIEPVHCTDPEAMLDNPFCGISKDGPDEGIFIRGNSGIFLGLSAPTSIPMLSIFSTANNWELTEELGGTHHCRVYCKTEFADTLDGYVVKITAITGLDYVDGHHFYARYALLDYCELSSDLYANGYTVTNAKIANEVSSQSEYTANLINSGTNENIMHSNLSYDSGELRWCHKENVFTYAESDIDPETDEWVYTGRYICYVELPIFMAENIQNDYHINICKMSWGDYRIIEKTPYYFILESQEDNFAFTFEVVAKLNDNQTLNANAIIANDGLAEPEDIIEQDED